MASTSPPGATGSAATGSAAPGLVARGSRAVRFDPSPAHRQPAPAAVLLATAVALGSSLLADFLLAKLAVVVFPSTKGYQHFQFGDYATLTILGVVVACAAWPVVTRLCAQPRWLFVRLAVLVTAILLLPDAAIVVQGQPARAVLFLALMHLAIGILTYNALVRIAPARRARTGPRGSRALG